MFEPSFRCLVASFVAVAASSIHDVNSVNMQQFSVNIYGNVTHEISPILYGIFFEEVHSPLDLLTLQCVTLRSAHYTLRSFISQCMSSRGLALHTGQHHIPSYTELIETLSMQINHAGDGGLYPEMIRDRSFEAMAAYSAAKAYVNETSKHATLSISNSSALEEATKNLQGWAPIPT